LLIGETLPLDLAQPLRIQVCGSCGDGTLQDKFQPQPVILPKHFVPHLIGSGAAHSFAAGNMLGTCLLIGETLPLDLAQQLRIQVSLVLRTFLRILSFLDLT